MKRLFCILLVCMLLVASGCSQSSPTDSPVCNDPDLRHAYFNLSLENQQDLNALYNTATYQNLLPQTVLDSFTFVEGYGVACDVPEHENVHLDFINEDGISLAIGISKGIYEPIADPEKPETYFIAWYVEWKKSPPPEAYNPMGQLLPPEDYSTAGLFYPEDLSENVLEGRTYTSTNDAGEPSDTSTTITVVCGEYRVFYSLSKNWAAGEEPEWIPYNEIYEMITSAKYFQK